MPRAGSTKKKFYVSKCSLSFGALHMGTFALRDCDALARYMWMNGYTSSPMDGFLRPPARTQQYRTTPRASGRCATSQHEGENEAPGFAYDCPRK